MCMKTRWNSSPNPTSWGRLNIFLSVYIIFSLSLSSITIHNQYEITVLCLRLNLPGNVTENGNATAKYDADSGTFDLVLPKQIPGEQFPDLELLTKLLAPKVKPEQQPFIENIDDGLFSCNTERTWTSSIFYLPHATGRPFTRWCILSHKTKLYHSILFSPLKLPPTYSTMRMAIFGRCNRLHLTRMTSLWAVANTDLTALNLASSEECKRICRTSVIFGKFNK